MPPGSAAEPENVRIRSVTDVLIEPPRPWHCISMIDRPFCVFGAGRVSEPCRGRSATPSRHDSAPVDVQVSVTGSAGLASSGLTVKLSVGGGASATVSCTLPVAEPPWPEQVRVNV